MKLEDCESADYEPGAGVDSFDSYEDYLETALKPWQ